MSTEINTFMDKVEERREYKVAMLIREIDRYGGTYKTSTHNHPNWSKEDYQDMPAVAERLRKKGYTVTCRELPGSTDWYIVKNTPAAPTKQISVTSTWENLLKPLLELHDSDRLEPRRGAVEMLHDMARAADKGVMYGHLIKALLEELEKMQTKAQMDKDSAPDDNTWDMCVYHAEGTMDTTDKIIKFIKEKL